MPCPHRQDRQNVRHVKCIVFLFPTLLLRSPVCLTPAVFLPLQLAQVPLAVHPDTWLIFYASCAPSASDFFNALSPPAGLSLKIYSSEWWCLVLKCALPHCISLLFRRMGRPASILTEQRRDLKLCALDKVWYIKPRGLGVSYILLARDYAVIT